MDRNQYYYDEITRKLEENAVASKTSFSSTAEERLLPAHKMVRSKSKEELHIISLCELIYDNRLNISNGDFIKMMDSLKIISSK